MFKGTYHYRLDGKGRLPVPAPFRRSLAASGARSLVVTLLDECLAAYPPAEWERLEAQPVVAHQLDQQLGPGGGGTRIGHHEQ